MIEIPKCLSRSRILIFCVALLATILDRTSNGKRELGLHMDDGSTINTGVILDDIRKDEAQLKQARNS